MSHMKTRFLCTASLLIATSALVACGSSGSTSTTSSVSPNQFKQEAQDYQTSLRTQATELATCATGSLLGGDATKANQCLQTFLADAGKAGDKIKQTTNDYLKTQTGPCKAAGQKFSAAAGAMADAFTTAANGQTGLSALTSAAKAVQDPATQKKLTDLQMAFTDMTKPCAQLAAK